MFCFLLYHGYRFVSSVCYIFFESFFVKVFVMFDTTLGCVVSIGAFVFGACRVFVGFATAGFRV